MTPSLWIYLLHLIYGASQNTFAESYKEDQGSATVNAMFNVTFSDNSDEVKDAKLAYGGIGPTPLLASKAQEYLIGKWALPIAVGPEEIPASVT